MRRPGPFAQDPKWIAKKLKPSIAPRQAEHALNVLLRLGLVVKNREGRLVHNEPVLSTGDEKPLGHHIANFHRTMLVRAAEALDHCERDEREIAGLTLSLSKRKLSEFKRRLYEFRQELVQLAVEAGEGEPRTDVVQINFQLFPLTDLTQRNEP